MSGSVDVEVFTGSLADAPEAPPERPRVQLVGTALASGAAAAVIGGMVAVHTQVRSRTLAGGDTWLPDDTVLPLGPGNMALVTLIMSAITVAWTVSALRHYDRTHAYFALGLTMLFGVAFVVDTVYLWQQLNIGVADSVPAVLIYSITGAHVAMAGAGMLYLQVMGFRALGGQLTGRAAEGMEAAALFWFVTIGVYALVWYAIYITK